MNYEVLKNKLTNGTPFTKKDAMTWIDLLPLSTTPAQVEELKAIANKNGLDFLPTDGESRLAAVESKTDEIVLAMADMIGGAI